MLKKIKKAAVIAVLTYLPIVAMAWGQLGHRIVGEIAYAHLTPKARVAVNKILGNEGMAMASNWPDFVKADTAYNYLFSWHYINFKDSMSQIEMNNYLKTDTATDAYTKINFLVAQLKISNLDERKKLMYLRLLIHIVGDVHQPLHVAKEEDRGGNKIKVLWFNQPANLHSIWDDKLIEGQQLSYTEYSNAIDHTTPMQVKMLQEQPMWLWFYHSNQIATSIYEEIKQPDQKLSYRYNYDHIATVNNQLLEGGVHLAGLLNQIFG